MRFSTTQHVRLRAQLMSAYQGLPYNLFLSRNSSEYILYISDNKTSIMDKILDRDGINILKNIEKLEFKDQTIELN